jgi:hypothetical protein
MFHIWVVLMIGPETIWVDPGGSKFILDCLEMS